MTRATSATGHTTMDALSEALDTIGLRGTLYFRSRWTPPWGVQVPRHRDAARFHLVVRGQCHVAIEGGASLVLDRGDMVVIPRGAPHVLADHPDSPVLPLDDVLERAGYRGDGVVIHGGPGDPHAGTELICGHFSFGEGADHPLLRALPDHLLVTAPLRAQHRWLDETMGLLARLVFDASPRMPASVTRLSEVLFAEAVRASAEHDTTLRRVIDALSDPRIGKALALIHRQPDRRWTVESLAHEVAMSRSRFAARFQRLTASTPMAYLSDWRLQRARTLLTQSRANVQQVADRVGYRSAAAFSRAFTQHFGKPPLALRREAAQAR